MLRPQRAIIPGRRNDAGFTLIEVLEFIVAAFLALWLAGRLASQFHGIWYARVFWAAFFIGTAAFGFSIMVGFAYVFDYIERRGARATTHESDKPDAGGEGVGDR